MKILQVTSHLNVGGISRYILSLSERLLRKGHSVEVASDAGGMESQFTALGLSRFSLPLNTSAEFSLRILWAARRLAEHLRKEPVDLLHAHTRVAQVVADQVSRRIRIPYVTTWHGIYRARLGRRLWPCAGRITIAVSNPVRQHLMEDLHIPAERIRCIYNGIDADHYAVPSDQATIEATRRRWRIPEGRPVIGGIGRMAAGRVKGFDSLLVAAYLLRKEVPELQILLVGDGPRRPFLEDVARRLGIRDRVHFLGPVADIRLPLALMDLFVFPSRWPEAFGLTLVEAMAAGKPVVATQVGAVPEIIRHGEEGWLVPPEEPGLLAEGVSLLLKDTALAQRIGRQGQVRVRECFNLDQMTERVEQVYQEALRRENIAGEGKTL